MSLLSSLARFLWPELVTEDQGEAKFGELTLPALEYLADRWQAVLDPAWITAKRRIRETVLAGNLAPDYLGIDEVLSVLSGQAEHVEAVRSDMLSAFALACAASEGHSISIADRVAVVFRAS